MNVTNHGTAVRLVMQLDTGGSWKVAGQQMSEVWISGQSLISRGK